MVFEGMDWIYLAQYRVPWNGVRNAFINLPVSCKLLKF